jgi:hypothetical protein
MRKLFYVVASIIVLTNAQAETTRDTLDKRHEVSISASTANLRAQKDTTTFGIGSGYDYAVAEYLQLGVEGNFAHADVSGAKSTTIQALAGPMLNYSFERDLSTAIFGGPVAGVTYESRTNTSSTDFTFGDELGARVRVVEHLSYRPTLMLTKVGDRDPIFQASALSFSALF